MRVFYVMFSTLFATRNLTFNATANMFMNYFSDAFVGRSPTVRGELRMSIVNFSHLRRASCSLACNTDVFNGPTITAAVLLSRRVPP